MTGAIVLPASSSGGGAGVSTVTAGDASIVVGGTSANPTVEAGTLDQVATLHPAAAAVPLNGQKITGLANGTASTDAAALGQISYGGVFGDGSDGSATLDGTATVGWATNAGSVYTLSRDAHLTSLTVNNGVTLNAGNYRIFCQGQVLNNGTISANGNAGSASGTAGAAVGSGSIGGSQAGGAGGVTTGSAGTGGNIPGISAGGAGGASGGNTGGAGGAGGNSSGLGTGFYRTPGPALNGVLNVFATARPLFGGPGGGGGGGDGTNKGGGGGSGGGPIVILAWSVVNNGTITSTGGAGGTPATGVAGGGGGGAGGLILIYTLSAWTAGTTAVTGGAAGSAVGGASNGVAGGSGAVLNVVVK